MTTRSKLLGVLFLLLTGATIGVVLSRTTERSNQARYVVGGVEVAAGVRGGFLQTGNAHSSETPFLVIDGKRFDDVIGLPPFCVFVPEARKIVFATDQPPARRDVAIHLFDIDSRAIDTVTTGGEFGWFFAADASLRPAFLDRVLAASRDEITFLSETDTAKRTFLLDLKTLQIKETTK